MGPLRDGTDHLRVLIANERKDRLAQVAPIVIALGHQVIALLHAPDPTFLREAAKRGVFAHISDDDVEDWQRSIEIVLRRFAEYHDLQGAFGPRALIERAKDVLMERHSMDADAAFEKLRERSRIDNRKLIDLRRPSSMATSYSQSNRRLTRTPSFPSNPNVLATDR